MLLIHSVFSPLAGKSPVSIAYPTKADQHEYNIKCEAYRDACAKYSDEIEAIQKFFPGWLPNPPSNKY